MQSSLILQPHSVSGYAVNLSLEMSVSCQAVLIGVLKDSFDDQAFLVLRAAVLQRMRSAAARQLADPSQPPDQATEDFKGFLRCCAWRLLGTSGMCTLACQCCIACCVNVLQRQLCTAHHCRTHLVFLYVLSKHSHFMLTLKSQLPMYYSRIRLQKQARGFDKTMCNWTVMGHEQMHISRSICKLQYVFQQGVTFMHQQ